MSQVLTIPSNGYLYCINNLNRQDYTERAFDFHVAFVAGNPSSMGHEAYQVVVESVQFTNLIPNVSKYNNTIDIQFNGSTFTLTLPQGNYDTTLLTTTINTWLTTINAGMSVTYNATTKLLTWVLPAGNSIQFIRPTVGTQFQQNTYSYHNSTYDRFWDMIGFIQNTGVIYTAGGSPVNIVGGDPVNLNGTSWVDVCVNTKLGCLHMGTLDRNILIRVPLTAAFNSVQFLYPPPVRSIAIEAIALDNLRITLIDAWGQVIDTVPNNTQFSLKLFLIALNQD